MRKLITDGEGRVGLGAGERKRVVRPRAPTRKDRRDRHQNNHYVKEVGTPPVRSNLCTSLTAV